ncbi:MAG: sensor histidine kinase [Dehalococcoidia bacterium]
MFPTLKLKLVLAFGLAVVVTVTLTGLGSFYLLRQEQIRTERERIGLLVMPTAFEVSNLVLSGATPDDIRMYLTQLAQDWRVRFVLVDQTDHVVVDTQQSELVGQTWDPGIERRLNARGADTPGLSFTNLEEGPQKGYIFAPSTGLRRVPVRIERQYDLRMLVPESNINGAWTALIPKLIFPSALALFASGVIAYLLARSIAEPVAEVTRASEAMARGQYDQQLPVESRDEIGRLAAAFNAMAYQVSRSHKMMRDLLANVAHELKTPLTSIQGFSQALLDGTAHTPEEQHQAARIINDEADRMRRLVEDLLYLSQLESGQLRMDMGTVDVPALLRDAAERVTWQLRDSNTTFRLNIAPGLPAITGDIRRLEQVLANLLDNAVRHTPAGGTITLQGEERNNTVILSVHNTGSFIPPELLPRVFERFYRADTHRSRDGRHGGLGLSIASEIVAAHGGSIDASSNPETGTQFRVVLPIPLDASLVEPPKPAGLTARLPRPIRRPAPDSGASSRPS